MLTSNIYDSYEQQLDIDEKDYFSDIYRLRKSSQIIQNARLCKIPQRIKAMDYSDESIPHL